MTLRSWPGFPYSLLNCLFCYYFSEFSCHLGHRKAEYTTQPGLSSGSTSSIASPWCLLCSRNVSTSMRPREPHASTATSYSSPLPLSMSSQTLSCSSFPSTQFGICNWQRNESLVSRLSLLLDHCEYCGLCKISYGQAYTVQCSSCKRSASRFSGSTGP